MRGYCSLSITMEGVMMDKLKEMASSCKTVEQVQMLKRYVGLLIKGQPTLKQRVINAIMADTDYRWNIENN